LKTTPMSHQVIGREKLADHPIFMLACEQGTGKTWMLLADAEDRFVTEEIEAVFVLAPKGVHTNWVRREIIAHLEQPHQSAYYLAGGGKRRAAAIANLFKPQEDGRKLRVLTMNIDAINFKEGYQLAEKFLRTFKCVAIVDESSRIKNPNAERTRRAIRLGAYAKIRRVASGTPITNSPIDIFAQFEFLKPGLLGTTSYRAFVAEYAQLLPPDHHLMQSIAKKTRHTPQIVARDYKGKPIWRNLDKLQRLIDPYIYRVLKKDCLDLPEKIYQTFYFELSASQRRVYDRMQEEMQLEIIEGKIDTFNALTKLGKLRQITSGFVMTAAGTHLMHDNPRMDALIELLQDVEGQFIVWAVYREEIAQIAAAFAANGIEAVEYHGGVSNSHREYAVDAFQKGEVRAFIGQPHSGGIGLTLTAATTAIYYSNDFSLEARLQSEDRCHRIGTTEHVVYIDLVAADTIDEQIATSLQRKQDVASTILDGVRNER
jgi:SNF2 family DNA or RNA helicase